MKKYQFKKDNNNKFCKTNYIDNNLDQLVIYHFY